MKKTTKFFSILGAAWVVLGIVSGAGAAPVAIDFNTVFVARGDDAGQNKINSEINPILNSSGSDELYQYAAHEAPDKLPVESLSLASSYDTRIDGQGITTITYTGGLMVGPTAFLLLKDGKGQDWNGVHYYGWYFYNLTALG